MIVKDSSRWKDETVFDLVKFSASEYSILLKRAV